MLKRKLAVLFAVMAVMGIMSISLPAGAATTAYPVIAQVTDRLGYTSDYEWYSITLRGGRAHKITLIGPSWADFDLKVYDENFNLIGSSTKGRGYVDTVAFTPSWTGTFYIKVYSHSGSGSFTLRIRRRTY
jgi:hypothetical protein